jgi:DNA-binding NarL/FixJ family response regulator
MSARAGYRGPRKPPPTYPSPRQMDVLRAMASGLTFRAAAHTVGTTRGHASGLANDAYRRLGTDNLVGAFIALGWLVPR